VSKIFHEDKPVILFMGNNDEMNNTKSNDEMNIGQTQNFSYITPGNIEFFHDRLLLNLIHDNCSNITSEKVRQQIDYIMILNYFATPKELQNIVQIDDLSLGAWIGLMKYSYINPIIMFGSDMCQSIFKKIINHKNTDFNVIRNASIFYGGNEGNHCGTILNNTISYTKNCVIYDPRKHSMFDAVYFTDGHIILFNQQRLTKKIRPITTSAPSFELLNKIPCVIISTGGEMKVYDVHVSIVGEFHITIDNDISNNFFIFSIDDDRSISTNPMLMHAIENNDLDLIKMMMDRNSLSINRRVPETHDDIQKNDDNTTKHFLNADNFHHFSMILKS
jgi:hypothetical protein